MSPLVERPWRRLANLLEEGREQGVYTGAVALVGLEGKLLWQGAAGRTSLDPTRPPVTPDTIFDLASLTKPLATTLALMLLADRGRISLEATLGEVLPVPWLPADKRPLTLKSLLSHRAGLPAWRPFFEKVLAAPEPERPLLLPRLAAAEPLENEPETTTLYSDLGFMLLGAVVEHLSGLDLETFCRQEVFEPQGLKILGFKPNSRLTWDNFTWAATEESLGPGEVHDENARAAGGVAGHAGLFGTGTEVFDLAAGLFHAYHGRGEGLGISRKVAQQFLTPVTPGGRTPGFDVPTPGQSSAGRFVSPHSVGHTGFTGTSFWLDLARGQMVVLLTNRVLLCRNSDRIKAFRPRFHEAACRALGVDKPSPWPPD
uniref:Class A beta-lactamase-related serine hydrolase n=1 Tax=Desulfobacca acetoxidans TaxID=60893 RepID=A0A7C3V4Y6_9BACT